MTAPPSAARFDKADQALYEKLNDALTPGYAAEFDPGEAQQAGAFVEDALSEADVVDSAPDLEGALPHRERVSPDTGGPAFSVLDLLGILAARPAGGKGE